MSAALQIDPHYVLGLCERPDTEALFKGHTRTGRRSGCRGWWEDLLKNRAVIKSIRRPADPQSADLQNFHQKTEHVTSCNSAAQLHSVTLEWVISGQNIKIIDI